MTISPPPMTEQENVEHHRYEANDEGDRGKGKTAEIAVLTTVKKTWDN